MLTYLLLTVLLFALAFAAKQLFHRFARPLSHSEESKRFQIASHLRSQAAAARREGKVPNLFIPKKYGPLGVRGFRAEEYFHAMMKKYGTSNRRFANIGPIFYPMGLKTMYPSDVIPNNVSNPYNNRYMLVKQAPPGTTLGASIAPNWTVGSDDICQILGAGDISIPLGILTDDVGNAQLDSPPYSGNVQLLGNSAARTSLVVTDSVLSAGSLAIGSRTTAGFAGPVPAIAGIYWCIGLMIGTSEGAGTYGYLDAGRFPIGVDVLT